MSADLFVSMPGAQRRRESFALLTSLLIHGLLLSITIAGSGFGLPGLGLPWDKRRAEVPDLNVVLAPEPTPPAQEPEAPMALVSEAIESKAEPARPEPVPPPPPAPEQQPVLSTTKPVAAWAVLPRASAPALTTPLAASSPASELTGLGDSASRELAELERRKREEEQQAELRRQQQLAAQREAARLETERKEAAARAEAARLEAERREQARQEALKQEAERTYAAARLAAERLEAARQEAARAEAARAEAARQEVARAEAAAKQEADRLEAAKQAAARAEAARQESARQEAARAEAARVEAAAAAARAEAARVEGARQEAARLEAAKQEAVRAAAAAREERLKAIGRQLNEEADRRSAGGGSLRRGRLFGRTDANAEMVLYAEAWSRKIELNPTIELMREALAKEPRYSDPLVTVAVRADGTVESITFVRSSGSSAVDAAVKRVIESQANYPPFHPALAREYDVIEIRRTWHFDSAIRLY